MAAEYSLIAGFGALVLFSVWSFGLSHYKSIVVVAIGLVMFGWGVWNLGGDFLLRRSRSTAS
jgi:hypothetical protein